MNRNFGFGFRLGSVFSLIIVFFIYLYSYNQTKIPGHHFGWGALAFVSKWYLIIVIGLMLLAILLPLILISLAALFLWISRRRKKKKGKKHQGDFIDVDYEIKK